MPAANPCHPYPSSCRPCQTSTVRSRAAHAHAHAYRLTVRRRARWSMAHGSVPPWRPSALAPPARHPGPRNTNPSTLLLAHHRQPRESARLQRLRRMQVSPFAQSVPVPNVSLPPPRRRRPRRRCRRVSVCGNERASGRAIEPQPAYRARPGNRHGSRTVHRRP
ncbi:hypothetical protein BS50DRAFT_590282 [Corynespora cassiicola Philippines]|uniref:Uncharacterized protein n=1 Tax=Corynespora cassiicola Philippines TaxID=1448308 RepID=A0A2T2NGA6_CORCC|nr:hypothetical protein BS50DRAFT_590282 [Corynespora cassiicola Philippines]